MAKFKVGDKVRRVIDTDKSWGMYVSSIYTVADLTELGNIIVHECMGTWDAHKFELVKTKRREYLPSWW